MSNPWMSLWLSVANSWAWRCARLLDGRDAPAADGDDQRDDPSDGALLDRGLGAAVIRRATKIDGELPTCAQKARPKPQIAAARRLTGWSGPSEACLIRRTRRMIAVQEPASGKCRLRSLGWRGLFAPDD